MSTRKTTAPAAAPAFEWPRMFPGFEALSDLPRQQATVACEAACAMFRGFEAMRRVQEQAAHQALARHESVAGRLKQPAKAVDLFALQADLMRFDIDAAAKYWQGLAGAAMEMQNEMAGCCAHLVDTGKVLEAAHSMDR